MIHRIVQAFNTPRQQLTFWDDLIMAVVLFGIIILFGIVCAVVNVYIYEPYKERKRKKVQSHLHKDLPEWRRKGL